MSGLDGTFVAQDFVLRRLNSERYIEVVHHEDRNTPEGDLK